MQQLRLGVLGGKDVALFDVAETAHLLRQGQQLRDELRRAVCCIGFELREVKPNSPLPL